MFHYFYLGKRRLGNLGELIFYFPHVQYFILTNNFILHANDCASQMLVAVQRLCLCRIV